MENILLLVGCVLVACVIFEKLFAKTRISGLLIFILLGMLFGSDGLFGIQFDDYKIASDICTVALVLIIYYGGMDTNLQAARPVLGQAAILSAFGTLLTAILTGVFAILALGLSTWEGLLLGSVVCSTDAASVFSILRSRKMNLRYGTASILEVESGSNDPMSYLLTMTVLTIMSGITLSPTQIASMLVLQILVGFLAGFVVGKLIPLFLCRIKLHKVLLTQALFIGTGFITYVLTLKLGGNGYLAVYIAGILIGNSRIRAKSEVIHFFDSLTGVMQMLLFFMLGLLSFPSRLPATAVPALLAALFLTIVARPIATMIGLSVYRACWRQIGFLSFAGMRGAASIAFAILAVNAGVTYDLFHVVFVIVLFSILVQGSFIPTVAEKLEMIDETSDVMTTFNDYTKEIPVKFIGFRVPNHHPWSGMKLAEIVMPPNSILVLIERGDQQIIPEGETVLQANDMLIMCGEEGGNVNAGSLYEIKLDKDDAWNGKRLDELSLEQQLVVLVRRGDRTIIPAGMTVLESGDNVFVMER